MTERQLASLESKFSAGNYYDLLQSYKALFFRNSNANKTKETVALLVSGATIFLKYEQWNCAAELCSLLVETYKKSKTTYDDVSKNTIITLFKGFRCNDNVAMTNFMRDAIKWSATSGAGERGSPEFHALLADTLAASGDYIGAQKHYIFGNDPASFATMLNNWVPKDDKSEGDLYIARAVFGYLCVKNLKDASVLFQSFVQLQGIEQANFTPLLNYIRFLLLTLERDALPLFNILKQKYAPTIARDPMFSKYLEQIANIYYKVPIQQSGGLGALLSGLMGGMNSPLFGGGGGNGGNDDVSMEDDEMD
ncbi:hypothetical protein SAMD00019534_105390 [Acytostelium subglobosum LB1]|uniref:hypothetical protein n=1 Tax=Acytostelium subglobosum LB1 TaxID=1410327 RepID=UPI000644E105|nr:hypothetical protein SAMD00019534_105390 [Acytostelium subglobosum LB1]GAM27364.1 hypothetical protein SAMD00019534_105390 [Acytostelium subglobosum LB1]|eukprot:XP_012749831.1 hypothetical protein SAMD00019534_105390 [Acytostelium subglobosum LB1]